MDILISSAMLAIALLMISQSISELRPAKEPEKRKAKPKRRIKARVPADWDRIMRETQLERKPRKK